MSIESLKKTTPDQLIRDQEILLKSLNGTDHIKARFLSLRGDHSGTFVAALEGATTGFPFNPQEWSIWVEAEYPLPARTDIETTIFNLVAQGQATGAPPSYGDMAAALISLMKGEVQTPVPVIHIPQEPTAEQEQQFEAAHEQDFQEDIDILEGIEGSDLEGFGSRN